MSKPRRVVYLDHTAALSGGELAMLRALPHIDGDPHVILGEHGPLEGRLRATGIAVEVQPTHPQVAAIRRERVTPWRIPLPVYWHVILHVLRLRQRLRALRPDVVHTNSLKSSLYGGVAGRLARVPVVWHLHDRIAPDYLPRSTVFLVRLLSRVVPTSIIANSQATLATLPAVRLSRPRDVVIPSAVALSEVRPRAPRHPSDPVVIGMAGRLAPWKGQDVFLRAFARAFPAPSTARARVIGDALFGEQAYAASLQDLARGLGVADRVTFAGHSLEIFAEYSQMDILVHASTIPEPFGQVVVEGLAAGVAVIATAAGGPLEIVTDGLNGLLVPPNDVEAMAEAMTRLVTQPELRRRLQREGPRHVSPYDPGTVGGLISKAHAVASHRTSRKSLRGSVGAPVATRLTANVELQGRRQRPRLPTR